MVPVVWCVVLYMSLAWATTHLLSYPAPVLRCGAFFLTDRSVVTGTGSLPHKFDYSDKNPGRESRGVRVVRCACHLRCVQVFRVYPHHFSSLLLIGLPSSIASRRRVQISQKLWDDERTALTGETACEFSSLHR
jgi:hypothetical protein